MDQISGANPHTRSTFHLLCCLSSDHIADISYIYEGCRACEVFAPDPTAHAHMFIFAPEIDE